jgi:hypothetical protein
MPTQIERLDAIRQKHQELDRRLARLAGEKASHEAAILAIEEKSKKDFGVSASELDALSKTKKEEAEKLLKEAELKLGISVA